MPQKKAEQGIVLLEVLVALTLLILITVPVYQLFSYAAASGKQAGMRSVAVFLAAEKMEEIKNTDRDLSHFSPEQKVEEFPQFRRSVTFSSIPQNEENVHVTVNVHWRLDNQQHEYKLDSYLQAGD